jgi:hypothetical protein
MLLSRTNDNNVNTCNYPLEQLCTEICIVIVPTHTANLFVHLIRFSERLACLISRLPKILPGGWCYLYIVDRLISVT